MNDSKKCTETTNRSTIDVKELEEGMNISRSLNISRSQLITNTVFKEAHWYLLNGQCSTFIFTYI